MPQRDDSRKEMKEAIWLSTSTATRIECENCLSESLIDGDVRDGDLVRCETCGADLIVSR